MKARVDQYTCVGCGNCNAVCPAVFQMDDNGKAVATNSDIAQMDELATEKAAAGCPVDAITVS